MIWVVFIVAAFAWTFAKLGAMSLAVRLLLLSWKLALVLAVAGLLWFAARALVHRVGRRCGS
ncbi:MAG: hypothetical protein ABIR54_01020 [Burkholderiaceae bacterium]